MNLQAHPHLANHRPTRFPRPLASSVAISLLVHSLLLWPSPVRTARPLLEVRLRPAPAVPVAPVAAAPVAAPLPRVLAKSAPIVAAPSKKMTAPSKAVRQALGPPQPDPVTAPTVAEASEPAGLADADSLRSFRIALALNARRFHQYPPQAIEQGFSGTAQVRVSVARNGVLGIVELLRSSGHNSLDREATNMLARAAEATLLPEALRGHAFAIDMPVEFSLPAR